jgi:carboxylate-amine ligase
MMGSAPNFCILQRVSSNGGIAHRSALEEFGEWDEVYALAQETMQQSNAAARQREVYKRIGSLEDVVDFFVRETAK